MCDSGSIGKSHGHDQELEGAVTHLKGCLPLVACSNTNIVVASTEVKLGVDLCTAQLGKEVSDEWNWVPILLSNFVKVPEVDTESQGAILLLHKEDRCTTWQLGLLDEPLAKHIIEEFTEEAKL